MHDQAAEVITFAVDGLKRVLGARHPYTLAAAMADEVLLADKGDFAKAERYRSSFGSNRPASRAGPEHAPKPLPVGTDHGSRWAGVPGSVTLWIRVRVTPRRTTSVGCSPHGRSSTPRRSGLSRPAGEPI
jgi:hypothetical protein